MKIVILTLFPEFFDGLKSHSIVGRAIKNKKIELEVVDLRKWAKDDYGTVDDRPYGGGSGMLLRVDVVVPAIKELKTKLKGETKVILTTPQGKTYDQQTAIELSQVDNLLILCGHYEGWDERIRDYVDMEVSIGDYILTGGELPAMIMIDSVTRLLPGVLGDDHSSVEESFTDDLLEYPQYTRPKVYEDKKVPEILLSGHHQKIKSWRKQASQKKTRIRRSDLLSNSS